MAGAPPDPGRPNERTALAWQRTALALVVAAAIVGRLTSARLGPLGIVVLATAVGLGLWVLAESRYRYAHDAGTRSRGRGRSGRAPFAVTVAVVLIGLAELVAVLLPGD